MNNNYKEVICEDCQTTFQVRNQHIARVKKCLLCKAISDRRRRNLHQRDMRILKRQNKISASSGAGALPEKNGVIGIEGEGLDVPLL